MQSWIILLMIILPVPWVAKALWPHEIKYKEMAVIALVSIVVAMGVYAAGNIGQTLDYEILSGEITKKERIHDSYVRTYSCRCRQVCSGSGQRRTCSEQCDTCYEDRYTVKWKACSNIRDFTIKELDEGSRSVYRTPDPARYTEIRIGDPVAVSSSFTNYVKAVPESLFHATAAMTKQYQSKIPPYPGQIYDFYKVNRVVPVGVSVPNLAEWNEGVSLMLRKLGPQRQANVIIVFVNEINSDYIHALEGAWVGGKKNDIIVVVGTTQYPKIDWVRISSWTDKQVFKINLRDELQQLGTVDKDQFLGIIEKNTMATFQRKSMKDFEYLADEIEPPMWVIILAGILGLGLAVGTSYYFYRNDPF